jgi:hypothetical protein
MGVADVGGLSGILRATVADLKSTGRGFRARMSNWRDPTMLTLPTIAGACIMSFLFVFFIGVNFLGVLHD